MNAKHSIPRQKSGHAALTGTKHPAQPTQARQRAAGTRRPTNRATGEPIESHARPRTLEMMSSLLAKWHRHLAQEYIRGPDRSTLKSFPIPGEDGRGDATVSHRVACQPHGRAASTLNFQWSAPHKRWQSWQLRSERRQPAAPLPLDSHVHGVPCHKRLAAGKENGPRRGRPGQEARRAPRATTRRVKGVDPGGGARIGSRQGHGTGAAKAATRRATARRGLDSNGGALTRWHCSAWPPCMRVVPALTRPPLTPCVSTPRSNGQPRAVACAVWEVFLGVRLHSPQSWGASLC